MQHAEDVTEAAKREASLEVALKKKGTAAAGGAAALASAQQKHAASLKLIHANHAATLKTMQVHAEAIICGIVFQACKCSVNLNSVLTLYSAAVSVNTSIVHNNKI